MTTLFADSNRASLREIVEVNSAWAATPATGRSRAIRFTSSSISVAKETEVSNEIRADRMVSSIVETAASSGGEINWEFSAGNQDSWLQRVLMGAWTRVMEWDVFRGKHISIGTTSRIDIAGATLVSYFTVGRRIKLSGFHNAANNTYAQVSAVAYVGGATQITITETVLVVETGNVFGTVQDANDVIIMKSAAIRSGTAGADAFDSNGGNVFAAAVAAGQLVAGQMIYVEGTGYEVGTFTIGAVPSDNEYVVVNDGVNTAITFEFQSDSDEAVANSTKVTIGVDEAANATALGAAINAARVAGQLDVVAVVAGAVVTITNLNKTGGTLSETTAATVVVNFAGGNATHGGFYTILTVTDDVITVDRDVPTVVAGKKITIKGSMLRNPGIVGDITPQSSSIETGFEDVDQFFLSDGQRAGGFSIEIGAGQIISGSTKLEGRATTRRSVAVLQDTGDYTVLDAPATENVSATANVGDLLADGAALSTAIKSIKIDVEGNLRKQQAVGSKFPVGISAGRLNVTGTIETYFADGSMWDRFLDHDTVSLRFPIIDVDNNTYYFTVPAFKIASDPVAPGGIDQDVMESLEFMAFRDSATACMMQIDRFSQTGGYTAF